MGNDAWEQATTSNSSGGLGASPAEEVALPAFVASRVAGREVAKRIFRYIEEASLAEQGVLLSEYDCRTLRAERRLLEAIESDGDVSETCKTIAHGYEVARKWWEQLNTNMDDTLVCGSSRGCDQRAPGRR